MDDRWKVNEHEPATWAGDGADDRPPGAWAGPTFRTVRNRALLVILVGLILGGTMIVAGQLACVLVDQRDLLERILTCLSMKRDATASS